MAKKIIDPFHNESDALQIGEFSIENRLDRVSLYGSLDITRDKDGLVSARQLRDIIDLIIVEMEASNLPDQITLVPTETVKNPFD